MQNQTRSKNSAIAFGYCSKFIQGALKQSVASRLIQSTNFRKILLLYYRLTLACFCCLQAHLMMSLSSLLSWELLFWLPTLMDLLLLVFTYGSFQQHGYEWFFDQVAAQRYSSAKPKLQSDDKNKDKKLSEFAKKKYCSLAHARTDTTPIHTPSTIFGDITFILRTPLGCRQCGSSP